MKYSRADVHRKAHSLPILRFEDQSLTSFSGLVVFQLLFARLRLRERLRGCFRHLPGRPIVGPHVVMLVLVVHLLLGYRDLRDLRYYADDPMVGRLLGLRRMPDVSRVSRALAACDSRSAANVRKLSREIVAQRLGQSGLPRITLDFDGSVRSTTRRAQGSAVGFNKRKKGARSYYPLFCTVAQTSQVLDSLWRSGNVHDSNGADMFIVDCLEQIWESTRETRLETRMDSAFFGETIVDLLDAAGAEFSISIPFERLPDLKARIEQRRTWFRLNEQWSYFELKWKPKSWERKYRIICLRQRVRKQRKGPLQLDLFEPREEGYEFTAIITNKPTSAHNVAAFHHGRGAQEKLFGELKTHVQMGHVPVATNVGNQLYMFASILAHNVTREMQMIAQPPQRTTTAKRPTLWIFRELQTLRRQIIQRAGRLTRPHGRLTLTMAGNDAVRTDIKHLLAALDSDHAAAA